MTLRARTLKSLLPWIPLLLALFFAAGPAAAQDNGDNPNATKPEMPQFDADRNVTVSTRDMDLSTFLELIAVGYKLNIVTPKDLAGKVSVNFHDVPPLDALRSVLAANGYDYTVEQTTGHPIIKVITLPKTDGAVPLTMRAFVLNYATAADVAKVATNLLTKNGSVTIAANRNAVVVQDIAETIQRIEGLVKVLDAAPKQVMIDAKIVELSRGDLEEKGFNWSMFQNMTIVDIAAEGTYNRVATRWTDTEITGQPDTNTTNIVNTTGNNVDLRGGVLKENNANIILSFFDSLTNTVIISRPSIRTIDNKPAHILSGQVVPIPLFDFAKDTGVRTLSGFQDQQIGVELTVTPHINEDGYITLEIVPKVESIDRFITVGGDPQRPVINTRRAETTIRIKDGDTAVIGGLTSATTKITVSGLPWLKDLPVIGWLFRKTVNDVSNNELVIFITPKTVKDGEEKLTDGEKKVIQQVEKSRLTK